MVAMRLLALSLPDESAMKNMMTASVSAVLLAVASMSMASAQERLTLPQAFATAWQRQPEARGGDLRRAAADARRDAAGNWLVAQPNLEVSSKTDRANRNDGSREYEVGVGLPLWLPGERGGAQALAEAERESVDSRLLAAQLQVAAAVRTNWWAVVQAEIELEVAQARLKLAEQLSADVARRVRVGDLARADQHQADGAVATAAAQLAEVQAQQARARQGLRSLLGMPVAVSTAMTPEQAPATVLDEARHPLLREIAARAERARKAKALAQTQTRNNPQLLLATTRERGVTGEPYAQTVSVGVRIPLGADNRRRERIVNAEADQLEAETRLDIERENILAEVESARARLTASQAQLSAAERRASLAQETRGFFDKSFRLGESDLPTRLRVELESYEADRQLARSRIGHAQAISQLRQALGLLPE
jgi:cobalt-zinc-cadmium efflux system outer membrane protein